MYTHRQHHVYYVFITNHFLHKDGEKQKGRPEKKEAKNNHLAEVISSGPVISLNEKVNAPLSLFSMAPILAECEEEEKSQAPALYPTEHTGERDSEAI